jgi:uncharacterized protein (TIGR03435 family)
MVCFDQAGVDIGAVREKCLVHDECLLRPLDGPADLRIYFPTGDRFYGIYRFGVFFILIYLMLAPPSEAQSNSTAAIPQHFDVTAIKLNPSCSLFTNPDYIFSPGRVHVECITLEQLIRNAYAAWADGLNYNIHSDAVEISGGPPWVRSEFYSVDAKADSPASRSQMWGPMLRTVLEDRFSLKVHVTGKVVGIYRLIVANKGTKIQPAKVGGCISAVDPNNPPIIRPDQVLGLPCGIRSRKGGIDVHGMTMSLFAARLGIKMDREVVDATGLKGAFDFHLEFSPDSRTPGFRPAFSLGGAPANPDSPALSPQSASPSIFSALEEQLGLKLQAAKGTTQVIIIDHIERPTPN